MTDPNYTAIAILVDRSGSMSAIKAATDGAIAEYIKGQVEDSKTHGDRRTLRLITFDTDVDVVYNSKPVADVPQFELQPRGMTALHDAMGTQIEAFGAELSKLAEDKRPGHVVFVVVTDGQENSSQEYSGQTIKTMVERQRHEFAWEFLYIGANQDAVVEGGKLGVPQHSSITYSATDVGTRSVVAAASAYTSSVSRGQSASFSEADRRRARTGR